MDFRVRVRVSIWIWSFHTCEHCLFQSGLLLGVRVRVRVSGMDMELFTPCELSDHCLAFFSELGLGFRVMVRV
jgi:hypothetical protein